MIQAEKQKAHNQTYRQKHRDQIRLAWKTYYQEHKNQITIAGKKYRAQLKYNVLSHYSNGIPACAICGFGDMLALSIDHMNGGGNKHRRALGLKTAPHFYLWLKRQGYPEGYQVLCMNCQFVKKHTADRRN